MSGVALDFNDSGGSTGSMLPHPVRPARPGWRPLFGGVVLGLLVPVVLVLAAAKLPQLELLPALIGFLLYKPALILQAVLDG